MSDTLYYWIMRKAFPKKLNGMYEVGIRHMFEEQKELSNIREIIEGTQKFTVDGGPSRREIPMQWMQALRDAQVRSRIKERELDWRIRQARERIKSTSFGAHRNRSRSRRG